MTIFLGRFAHLVAIHRSAGSKPCALRIEMPCPLDLLWRAPPTTASPPLPLSVPFHRRFIDTVFGAKGGEGSQDEEKAVNPVTRLKLLLVSYLFLTPHKHGVDHHS